MQKVCLYLEKLALVQQEPDAPQTELTDVVVTHSSPLGLPPVQPYEYLLDAEVSAVMQFSQSAFFCHSLYGDSRHCWKA